MTHYTKDGLIILPNSVGLQYKSKRRFIFMTLQETTKQKYMNDVLRDLKEYWKIHKKPDEEV